MPAADRPRRVLVTGEKRAGKTTFCRALVEAARAQPAPVDVAGLLSPGLHERGEQVGIEVEDLRTGRRRLLARLRTATAPGSGTPTGRWRFDEEALAWANAVLLRATPCRLLVIDELGPLEFEEGRGWPAGLDAVDGGDFAAAVVVVRPRLLPMAQRRWPGAEVIEVRTGVAVAEAAARLTHRLFAGPQATSR